MSQIDPSLFIISPISSNADLSQFCCTDDDLNTYLKEDALRDHQFLYSVTKLVEYERRIVGYFTLVTDTINPKKVSEDVGKKYEYSKLPAIKIARFATDKEFVGRGVGSVMMRDIYRIVLNTIMDMGCRVITVDSKRDAKGFYEHFAFQETASKQKSETTLMYLDIRDLISIAKNTQ